MLMDHGVLRVFWTHEYEIAPGVWRSNQPSPRRIEGWAARGIKSVLYLRSKRPDHLLTRLEREACANHGIDFRQVPVPGAVLLPAKRLLDLLDHFKSVEKPFVMHCKSGIDRTGLAAFLYVVSQTDTPPRIARSQLSFKYLHLRNARHGILDFMADSYLAAYERTGIGLRDWAETAYDAEELTERYKAGKGRA